MSEQRKQTRKDVATRLSVVDINTGILIGELANISDEGFMVLTARQLPLNAVFQLSLGLPKTIRGVDTLYFGAESLWCTSADNAGHYWVGFHLIDISPQDHEVLTALLETV